MCHWRLRCSDNCDGRVRNVDNANCVASLGLISSKIYTEIPIIKKKSALMLSFRRSYFDVLTKIKAKLDMENERNKIGFYDAYLKYEHNINSNSLITFNYFRSRDKFYYIFNNLCIFFY